MTSETEIMGTFGSQLRLKTLDQNQNLGLIREFEDILDMGSPLRSNMRKG